MNLATVSYPRQNPHPPIWLSTGMLDRVRPILACEHSVLFDYMFSDFDTGEIMAIKAELEEVSDLTSGNVAGVLYTQLKDTGSAYNSLHRYYIDFLRRIRGPEFCMERAWQELQHKGRILCCSVDETKRRVERVA